MTRDPISKKSEQPTLLFKLCIFIWTCATKKKQYITVDLHLSQMKQHGGVLWVQVVFHELEKSMNSQLDEFCSSTETNSQACCAKSILFRQSKLPEGLSALENNPHPCTRKAMTARIEALKVVPRNGYVHIATCSN